jgi:hypothetical protein
MEDRFGNHDHTGVRTDMWRGSPTRMPAFFL